MDGRAHPLITPKLVGVMLFEVVAVVASPTTVHSWNISNVPSKSALRHDDVETLSLISPDGSAPAALASLLFEPPEPQNIGKKQSVSLFHWFSTFCAPGVFFLCLSLLWLFPPLLFHLSILLNMLTYKLPSIILDIGMAKENHLKIACPQMDLPQNWLPKKNMVEIIIHFPEDNYHVDPFWVSPRSQCSLVDFD